MNEFDHELGSMHGGTNGYWAKDFRAIDMCKLCDVARVRLGLDFEMIRSQSNVCDEFAVYHKLQ